MIKRSYGKGVRRMTAKRFRVTISNTNAVSFVDVVEKKQLMSITFKNKSDAIDCKNALMYQCDLLNELDGKWIGEFSLRETLQQDLQRVEEENKTLKTRFKEERELAMKLGGECDTLTIKKQELELEIIRLETIIRISVILNFDILKFTKTITHYC